jgi:hypothetical protein
MATSGSMSSYIRVKRYKLTIFLHCDLHNDTVLVLKERIEKLEGQPVMHQRLLLGKQVLENNTSLIDCGIEKEDQCLTLVKRANEDAPWEDPNDALAGIVEAAPPAPQA